MIERSIYPKILSWINEEKILIIKGSRQVGKTTLLKILQEDLQRKGNKVLFYSIDLEINNPLFKNPKDFIIYLKEQIIENDKVFIILDEFQYLENAGLFIKVVFDALKEKTQIIVSGSSSLEIGRSTEFLTGRKVEFNLLTLSFHEYCNYKLKTRTISDEKDLIEFNRVYHSELKRLFLDYINYGGYPEVVLKEEPYKKKVIVKEIVSTYLQKDISGFFKIENLTAYNKMIKILSSRLGNLLNVSELSSSVSLSMETCKKYITFLEGTYVFYLLKPLYRNIRKEISKMPKVFLYELSIANILLDTPKIIEYEDIPGPFVENYIFKELLSKEKILSYYRTISKAEIDFVVNNEGRYFLVESKFRNQPKASVIFKNFSEDYPVDKKFIITKNTLEIGDINYIPAYLLPFCGFLY
jgi:uncharacterized protein